ncbi:MAG: hypothetical protein JWO22_2210 [Frankiales bacterium]|nr:hypothetical protein [Frankiales bacterium]
MADILDTSRESAGARRSVLSWLSGPRAPQGVLAAGLSVLAAAGATVVLRSADPASADTTVAVARLAQVYLPDGSNHPAQEGEVLPRGAELHTGQGGGAQLTTAGRRVYVGALSTLKVQDGVRQALSLGSAMVDARDGARLTLTTPAGAVSAPGGSVVRVEEGQPLTRIAAYAGTATLHPVGRASTTDVHALFQVKVQPASLPQRETPLQLAGKDDPWDPAVAADLVAANGDLESLADGLATDEGATYLASVYRSTPPPSPGPARGEEALAVLVARASTLTGDPLALVRGYRADLGSWGVVAALVKAKVADISSVLDAALAPTSPTAPGSPTTVNAGPTPNLPRLSPSASPSRGGSARPTTRPTATPTTSPTHVDPSAPPGLVQTVVSTVTGLLPHPTQVAAPAGNQPVATPTPSTKAPCLLGIVLCRK